MRREHIPKLSWLGQNHRVTAWAAARHLERRRFRRRPGSRKVSSRHRTSPSRSPPLPPSSLTPRCPLSSRPGWWRRASGWGTTATGLKPLPARSAPRGCSPHLPRQHRRGNLDASSLPRRPGTRRSSWTGGIYGQRRSPAVCAPVAAACIGRRPPLPGAAPLSARSSEIVEASSTAAPFWTAPPASRSLSGSIRSSPPLSGTDRRRRRDPAPAPRRRMRGAARERRWRGRSGRPGK